MDKGYRVPLHQNDMALLIGDAIWFVWNIYGLAIGVPVVWGIISLICNFFSTLLILSKYYDKDWVQEVT